jgi:hypothetical protein
MRTWFGFSHTSLRRSGQGGASPDEVGSRTKAWLGSRQERMRAVPRGARAQSAPIPSPCCLAPVAPILPNTAPLCASPILRPASSAYSRSASAPAKNRPSSLAAIPIVPDPLKGSKTSSPSVVEARMARLRMRRGFRVAPLEFLPPGHRGDGPDGGGLPLRVLAVNEVVVEGVLRALAPACPQQCFVGVSPHKLGQRRT